MLKNYKVSSKLANRFKIIAADYRTDVRKITVITASLVHKID